MPNTLSKVSSTSEGLPDLQILQQAAESQDATLATNKKKRKGRRCGKCGATGHNCRTCPKLGKERRRKQNGSQKRPSNRPELEPRPTTHLLDAIERCYCIVFNIETTSFSIQRNEITQVAAKIISNDGTQLEDGLFSSLVKSEGSISNIISSLTRITNEDTKNEKSIEIVLKICRIYLSHFDL